MTIILLRKLQKIQVAAGKQTQISFSSNHKDPMLEL